MNNFHGKQRHFQRIEGYFMKISYFSGYSASLKNYRGVSYKNWNIVSFDIFAFDL